MFSKGSAVRSYRTVGSSSHSIIRRKYVENAKGQCKTTKLSLERLNLFAVLSGTHQMSGFMLKKRDVGQFDSGRLLIPLQDDYSRIVPLIRGRTLCQSCRSTQLSSTKAVKIICVLIVTDSDLLSPVWVVGVSFASHIICDPAMRPAPKSTLIGIRVRVIRAIRQYAKARSSSAMLPSTACMGCFRVTLHLPTSGISV